MKVFLPISRRFLKLGQQSRIAVNDIKLRELEGGRRKEVSQAWWKSYNN